MVHLDVGPHLEEKEGVEDGHPRGAIHADAVRLDINHNDGDGEHEVGHVEEHSQLPGQDVLGYQLLLEQDQEDGNIVVKGEVESRKLALNFTDKETENFSFLCLSPDYVPDEKGGSLPSQSD